MNRFHYLDEITRHTDEFFFPPDEKVIVITPRLFNEIGDYTRSQPTGPKPGRVYRKNLGWPADMPDNWWLYICELDTDPAYVLHRPYRVVLTSRLEKA